MTTQPVDPVTLWLGADRSNDGNAPRYGDRVSWSWDKRVGDTEYRALPAAQFDALLARLRDARREALEEAARMCDEVADASTPGGLFNKWEATAARGSASKCAKIIRALATAARGETRA